LQTPRPKTPISRSHYKDIDKASFMCPMRSRGPESGPKVCARSRSTDSVGRMARCNVLWKHRDIGVQLELSRTGLVQFAEHLGFFQIILVAITTDGRFVPAPRRCPFGCVDTRCSRFVITFLAMDVLLATPLPVSLETRTDRGAPGAFYRCASFIDQCLATAFGRQSCARSKAHG